MKHIALFLIVAIICTMIPGVIFASENTVFYSESFNNQPTNSVPASIAHLGDKTARVVDDGKNNKAFMMKGDVDNNVNFEFKSDTNSTVVSFAIKMDTVRSKCIVSIGGASKTLTAVTLNEDGSIISHDGKRIGGIPKNRYTTISIGYSSKTKKYFFAQDGVTKISNWNSGVSLGNLGKVSIELKSAYENGNTGTIYLDNICVYAGDKIRNNIPQSAYSNEVIEYVEPPVEEAGTEVILAKTFDEEVLSGLVADAKNNVLETRKDKNNNGYLYVNKTESTDTYITLSDVGGYGNYIVAQIDVRRVSGAPLIRLLQMRDVDKVINRTLSITTSGAIQFPNGETAGTVGNSWTTIAIACDFNRLTFDCYVNGSLVKRNVSMSKVEFGPLSSCRIYFEASNKGEVMFDNFFVYEGKEPREIEVDTTTTEGYNISNTIIPDANKNVSKLLGTTAFHAYSGAVYHDGIKDVYPDMVYPVGDNTMISTEVLSQKLKMNVISSPGVITVDDKLTFEIGKNIMKTPHGDIVLSMVPEAKDGKVYLPLEDLYEKGLRKNVFKNDDGLVVVSEGELPWADENVIIKDVNNFMFFERKSASEIKEIFENSGNLQKHPRILTDADTFARLRKECKSNPYVKKWNMEVMAMADKYLTAPVNEYKIPDGLRLLDTSRAVLDYVMALGYAYQITGNRKYARRVWTELEAAGNFPDWNPKHFLDIGEMTTAFAVGYDWCYNEFSEEERKFIEDKIINYGLLEGKKYYEGIRLGTDFVRSGVNWNVVCNGGLAIGAMAIADKYPDISFYILECATRSLENMLPNFAPDGGWGEGPGYWGYTVRYLAYFTDSLKSTFNTDFGLLKYKGVSKTGDFVINLHGHTGSNAYHDSWSEMSINEYCAWVGSTFNRPDITSIRLHIMDKLNIKGTVKDLLWYDSSVVTTNVMPPLDGYTKGVESGSMRTSWTDTDSMFVSYHGGNTKEGHYHIDGGSFVLDMLGIRWAIDIGPGNYNDAGYFGTNRDKYYRIRAEGHNVYVINPSEDGGQDMKAFSPIIKTESKQKGAYQVLDLTSAYKDSTNSAIRGYMLSNNRRTFTVQDEISLKEESEMYWFMHTYSNIEIVDSNTAILTQDGNKMQFKFVTNADEASLVAMDAVPLETSPQITSKASNKGIRKIAIKLKAKGDIYITARVTPLYESGANEELKYTPIDNWVLEDGDITPLPEAQMMYVDGVPVDNFSPRVTGYNVSLAYDFEHMPIPTLKAEGMVVDLTEAKTVDDIWQFKVYRPGDEKNYRIYTFSYTVLKKLGDVLNYKRHTPGKIYASAVPEEENGPLSTIDEDLSTKWAASGTQWIEQDFGGDKKVNAVAVAFASGDTRSYKFKIEISSDGKNYQTVFDGASKGGTTEYEIFDFGKEYNARFVRYTGSGNSSNGWNSLMEFAVLETK